MKLLHNCINDISSCSSHSFFLKMKPFNSSFSVDLYTFSSIGEEQMHQRFQFHIKLASNCKYLQVFVQISFLPLINSFLRNIAFSSSHFYGVSSRSRVIILFVAEPIYETRPIGTRRLMNEDADDPPLRFRIVNIIVLMQYLIGFNLLNDHIRSNSVDDTIANNFTFFIILYKKLITRNF
jgi:hypothetical protein